MANRRLKEIAFWGANFAIPILMLCVIVKITNVYPFGDLSFLSEDLKYQYIDFYQWFKRVLCGQESIFYSTSLGLGANTWGLYSYYLASPLNFLVLLFDENKTTLFIFVVTGIKLGLMQIASVFYLTRRFNLNKGVAFALAIGFTWSLWVATDLRNPMWIDSLILLPLIMLGTFKVVQENKWVPLAILLSIDIMICWYTAYMSVIFTIMLAIVEWAHCGKKYSFFKLALRFAKPFIIAILISAWTLLPTIEAMSMSGSEATSFFESIILIFTPETVDDLKKAILTTRPFFEAIVRGLIPFLYKLDYVPQLYGGLLFIFCLIMFFATNVATKKTKRIVGIFIVVLLVSIFFNPLEAIWCGFRRPNGLFSRPCMFIAPTLMWISGLWLQKCKNGDVRLNVGSRLKNKDLSKLAFISKSSFLVLLSAIVIVDFTLTGCFAWRAIYKDYTQEQNDDYYSQSNTQISWLKNYDASVWRMERTFTRASIAALNESLSCNYLGVSTYSSSHNKSALNLINGLGYGSSGRMHTRYSNSILLIDSILGVKYTSDFSRPVKLEEVEDAPRVYESKIFSNPYALSLGYSVPETLVDATLRGQNCFEYQNSFASALLGYDVEIYKRCDSTLTQNKEDEKIWSVEVPEGAIGYLKVNNVDESIRTFLCLDDAPFERAGWRFNDAIKSFNTIEEVKSGTHNVVITTEDAFKDEEDEQWTMSESEKEKERKFFRDVDCDFYYLDLEIFNNLIDKLSQSQINFSQFSGNGIVGKINADEDGLAMISVPKEKGWSVFVNGGEVETQGAFDNALTLVPVKSGENLIEMHFQSPGLIQGAVVSSCTILALMCFYIIRRRTASIPSSIHR